MNRPTPASCLVIASAVLLSFASAGCSKHENNEVQARVKDAYEEARTAVADGWQDVKSYTFEKRKEFGASASALNSRMDSQVDQLRANYSEARASASRKAAMDELKNSQAEFKAKVDALSRASADTWDSAKQNVMAAWDRVQVAYKKARDE